MAFAASTIIATIGLGVTAVGTYEAYENSQKAASSQSQAAQQQAIIAQLQAQNVDVEKQQLGLKTSQDLLQSETQRSVIQQQAQADAIRQQAAVLDAARQRRDAIRAGIVARANSLTATTNQGAGQPGTTAFRQSEAGISGQTNENTTSVSQNLDIGTKLYNINQNITGLYLNASYKNDEYVKQSEGLQSQVLDTQKQIYQHGGTASKDYAQAAIYQGNAAMWQGISSLGTSLVNNQQAVGKITNYFGSQASSAFNSFNNSFSPYNYTGSLY